MRVEPALAAGAQVATGHVIGRAPGHGSVPGQGENASSPRIPGLRRASCETLLTLASLASAGVRGPLLSPQGPGVTETSLDDPGLSAVVKNFLGS